MSRSLTVFCCLFCLFCLLASFVIWPEMDLAISGFFAHGPDGFFLRNNLVLNGLANFVFYASRLMFVGVFFIAVMAYVRKKKCLGISGKAWLFLWVALIVGPGLIVNVFFKDHWGRARPRQITVFGGEKDFTPAFVISHACHRNCSFVSGDASYGFFLTCFAFVVPRRYGRRVFWGTFCLGSIFAGARILLGAHFASDVLYAMIITLGVSAGLHAVFYGWRETKGYWREWMGLGASFKKPCAKCPSHGDQPTKP